MAKRKNTKIARVKNAPRKIYSDLVDKSVSLVRQDIGKWKSAWTNALNADHPSRWQLYNLYDSDVTQDALVSSQINNRMNATLGAGYFLTDKSGEVNEELTKAFQSSRTLQDIIKKILDTTYYGHSLIELDWDQNKENLKVNLIPRQNVLPKKGVVLKDYSDIEGIPYRNLPEFGTWILEFGDEDDLGILNKAVPHVLFKKFAHSCWSELAEIYGIPPRVYKTDTQDPQALARGKRMMTDMGAAAWFIIDSTEEFEWAKGVQTNGDVYSNLIRMSDNQNSLLIQGAIIGQDTEHGSYGKDAAGQNLLDSLVLSDMAMVEMEVNTTVMPALARIGLLPEGTQFGFEVNEDLESLWTKVKESINSYEFDIDWLNEKFGLKITAKKEAFNPFENNLKASEGFFV